MRNLLGKFWRLALSIGPGLFAIGYTIGTGSVTSMSKAGSEFSMQLLWVLALSSFFAGLMMEVSGRFALVTGETTLHACRRHLRFGSVLAVLIGVGVVVGQWFALTGLTGLSSTAIYEGIRFFLPQLPETNYWVVLGIAIAVLGTMYSLIWIGSYALFEKVLVSFVVVLGLSFFLSFFLSMPEPSAIAAGMIPVIPDVPGANLMVAAFVGTTFAAPVYVVRPLFLKAKGWGRGDLAIQSRDAIFSATLMFLISAAIMASAAGALHGEGITINRVLDMVNMLEPVAGRFAVALFLVGLVSAGLSSVFPAALVAALLVCDFQHGKFEGRSTLVRTLGGMACLFGLLVPILGTNPIMAQIATQVSQVFVLPLVIGTFFVLVNRRSLMGDHKAGWFLNIGMVVAFGFSLVMSSIAVRGLLELFGAI